MHFKANSADCTSERHKIDSLYITLFIVRNHDYFEDNIFPVKFILIYVPLGSPHHLFPLAVYDRFRRVRIISDIASCPHFENMDITVLLGNDVQLTHIMDSIITSEDVVSFIPEKSGRSVFSSCTDILSECFILAFHVISLFLYFFDNLIFCCIGTFSVLKSNNSNK